MPIKSVEQLKSWFRRGMYPTEQNFADLIDSFHHRGSKLPISSVEGLDEKLKANKEYIPIDLRFGLDEGSPRSKELLLHGKIPEGYVPVVFRRIRRKTQHTHPDDAAFFSQAQWVFYGTAVLSTYGQDPMLHRIGFHELRAIKETAPYKDHNQPPQKAQNGTDKPSSTADEFVLVHNVDTSGKGGGEAGYPQEFDLRVAWGGGGSSKRCIFVDKGIGQTDMRLAAITLHLGIGLIREEVLSGRLITPALLSSNLATFKIVHNTSLNGGDVAKKYSHDYKPSFSFTR